LGIVTTAVIHKQSCSVLTSFHAHSSTALAPVYHK